MFMIIGTFHSINICLVADSTTYYQIGKSTSIKTLDEMLKLLDENSTDIKQLKLEFDSKIYEFEAAEDLVDYYQDLYDTNAEISDPNTLDSIRKEYLSALLNREILSFYKMNKIELVSCEVMKQKYNFINMFYQIMVLEKHEAYYTANTKYLSACKSIANIKYKYGRSTALEVSEISALIEENASALYEIKSEQEKLFSKLEDMLGMTMDFSVRIPLHTTVNNYALEDTISLIDKNEYSYEEAIFYRDAYDLCNTCKKAMIGSVLYKKNSTCMQQYSLQAEMIKKNIKIYTKSMISGYKKACKKLTAASKKLKNNETIYNNSSQKYRKGKVSKVDVLKADTQRAEAEYNYYSILSDKIMYEYMLDNGIYVTDVE